MNLAAASAMAAYFAAAVAGYTLHGVRQDTVNQFTSPPAGLKGFMISLIVVEIGAWLVLVAPFVCRQFRALRVDSVCPPAPAHFETDAILTTGPAGLRCSE